MEKEWACEGKLSEMLREFSVKMLAWNRDVFGNIFGKKRMVKSQLEGVMKAIDKAPTLGLLKLERKLK